MALNRQFMDFCLCYKIKNKSNINTGIHPRTSRALRSASARRGHAPRAPGGPAACGDTVTAAVSSLPGGRRWERGSWERGSLGEGQPRASSRKGFVRLEVDGSVRSPGEVGSNFQIVFGGRGRELERGLPSLFRGIFCGGTCGSRPPPPAPPPVVLPPLFFFFYSLFLGGRRWGRRGRPPARVPGGEAGLSAVVSAPRASHHLAEPLLKTQQSVCAQTLSFYPRKIIVSSFKINTRLAISTFFANIIRRGARGRAGPSAPGPQPSCRAPARPGPARPRAAAAPGPRGCPPRAELGRGQTFGLPCGLGAAAAAAGSDSGSLRRRRGSERRGRPGAGLCSPEGARGSP